ncbi:MAG: TolC family protein [bacterium]
MKSFRLLAKLIFIFIVAGCFAALSQLPTLALESNSVTDESSQVLQKDQLQVEDLKKLAILNNPELAAIRFEQAASEGSILQSSLKPNPSIEVEAGDVPTDSPSDGQLKISYVQPHESVLKRKSVVRTAKLESEYLEHQYNAKEREIVGNVQLVYTELISNQQALVLYESLLKQAGETVKIAETRLSVKSATITEVIKTRVEVDELKLGKERIENRLVSLSERLTTVCGIEVLYERVAGLLPGTFPVYDSESLKETLLNEHPLLSGAGLQVKVAEARYEEAIAGKKAGYDLRFSYGHHFGENDNFVEAGIEFPLTTNDKNEGNILETKNLIEEAKSRVTVVKNELIDEITQAHEEYINARTQLVTLKDTILPSVTKVYDNTLIGYQYGKNSLLDILDAQRTLFSTQLLVWELAKDANLALSRLMQIGGDSLNGLNKGELE